MKVTDIRSLMVKNGFTQKRLAKAIGMSSKTFSIKMKRSSFGIDEASKLIDLLHIENPSEIFFDQK